MHRPLGAVAIALVADGLVVAGTWLGLSEGVLKGQLCIRQQRVLNSEGRSNDDLDVLTLL
jgi:hypothetical protein